MNLEPALRTWRATAAVSFHTMLRTWTSFRFLLLMVAAGILVILFAWRFAALAVAFPGEVPGTVPVWDAGSDGALTALAFLIVPILLPFVPIGVAYDFLARERRNGFLETALTRSLAPWRLLLAVFLGLFLAVAIPWLLVDLVCVLLIWGVGAAAPSGVLALGFAGGTVLLLGLYLVLVLILSTFLPRGLTYPVSFLMWVFFNAVRSTALSISSQFLLMTPTRVPQVFEGSWGDLFSFTGLYQGLVGAAVPRALGFVADPGIFDLSGTLATLFAPMAGLPIFLFLLAFFLYRATRDPLAG